jgi:C4-type Zn-finger protein
MQAIAHAQGLQIDEKTFCPHCGTIYQFGKSCVAKHLPGVKKRSTCIKRMAIKCSKCQFRQEVRVKIERKKPKAVDVAKSASRASTVVPARKSEQQAKHSPKPPQNSAGMKEKPKQSGLGKFLSNIGIK